MSGLSLRVDHDAPTPPYEQIKDQITAAVDAGVLAPGDRLPPVRTLAADIGVAVNTVARSYKELEAAGVVATRGRAGTVVLGAGAARAAREAAAEYAAQARRLGVGVEEAVDLLRRAFG